MYSGLYLASSSIPVSIRLSSLSNPSSSLTVFRLVDTVTRDDPNNLRNTEQMLAFSTSFPDTSGNLAIQGETMENKFWEPEAQSPEELLESLGFEEQQPLFFNQNSSS